MNKKFITSGIAGILFILLIVLVKTVDVAAIGPAGTSIGLSKINGAVAGFFGTSMFWYKLTNVIGILAILIALCFALFGGLQMILRKSLVKVDKELFSLAGLYVVVAALYVFFEKVIINYRPVIMPDETEPAASFPSSHTMLICVIMGSTMVLSEKYLKRYIENKTVRDTIKALCGFFIVLTVFGRLACGVHWFTDILGGVLISIALVAAFAGVIDMIRARRRQKLAK